MEMNKKAKLMEMNNNLKYNGTIKLIKWKWIAQQSSSYRNEILMERNSNTKLLKMNSNAKWKWTTKLNEQQY